MTAKKRKEVVSHPNLVKFLSVVTSLFMIGTFAVNGIVMAAGANVNWGFYPNKLQPSIQASFNNATLEMTVAIPVYVNNTQGWLPFGFDIQNLTVDFNIYNETALVASQPNDFGNIPFGMSKVMNVTLVEENALQVAQTLNSSTLTLEILFHVKYIFTTVDVNCSIVLPGGLSF